MLFDSSSERKEDSLYFVKVLIVFRESIYVEHCPLKVYFNSEQHALTGVMLGFPSLYYSLYFRPFHAHKKFGFEIRRGVVFHVDL